MNGIFFLFIGICVPLLVRNIRGNKDNEYFRLDNFSKILCLGFIYYGASYYGYRYVKIDLFDLNFYVLVQMAMAIATIFLVLRYSTEWKEMLCHLHFPKLERNSKLYFLIIVLFCFSSISELLSIKLFQDDMVKFGLSNIIAYKAVTDSPLNAIPILLFVEFLGVVGEELLFRYYAFHALKQKVNEKTVIVISAIIWTLVHPMLSPHVFVIGILIGYLYLKTASLSLCIALHFLVNICASAGIFFVGYTKIGWLDISLFEFSLGLLAFQFIIYHVTEFIFANKKQAKREAV